MFMIFMVIIFTLPGNITFEIPLARDSVRYETMRACEAEAAKVAKEYSVIALKGVLLPSGVPLASKFRIRGGCRLVETV